MPKRMRQKEKADRPGGETLRGLEQGPWPGLSLELEREKLDPEVRAAATMLPWRDG